MAEPSLGWIEPLSPFSRKKRFATLRMMTIFVAAQRIALICLSVLLLAVTADAQVQISSTPSANVLDGESPHLLVTGLRPGEQATVHALRKATVYEPGSYTGVSVLAHAEAVFIADNSGQIAIDSASPLRGTYSGSDPLGLLWSGTRLPLAGDVTQPITRDLHLEGERDVVLRVAATSLGETRWAETRIHLTDDAGSIDVQDISLPKLNGAFARPKAASTRTLPAILLLHGSEGGSRASARAAAIRFAHLGYAAFALNYFAWPAAGLTGVPQAFVDIPVEELATARTWLMSQPGVDARSVALWGVSKGAEFALVGAAHYSWIDRVVACVPTNVVWSGFGRPPVAGEVYSSWSIDGKGLPNIPYDNYQDVFDGKFSAAFVHQRSLAKTTPEQRAAARIPIEKSNARILLLAATNDVVWPSGTMTNEIERALAGVQTRAVVRTLVFPNASHFICGTGSEPRRVDPVHKPEGDDPSPEADAHAARMGWQETQAFLRQSTDRAGVRTKALPEASRR